MIEQQKAVQRMQDFIEENLYENISLGDLAKVSLFSPWYSYRLLKEWTNHTPSNYIRKLRLSKSALRLRDENQKIVDIAFEMGFGSVDGYQRAFQREFGINPSEYALSPVPIYLFIPYGVKFRKFKMENIEKQKLERQKMKIQKLDIENLGMKKLEIENLGMEKLDIEKLDIEKIDIEKIDIEKIDIEKIDKENIKMEIIKNVFIQMIEKPQRKVIIKRGIIATSYFEYCEEVGGDIWGLLKSVISISGEPVCLWLPCAYIKPETSLYVQGVEVPANYDGIIPDGFDMIELPSSKYLMFQGEPFAEEEYCKAIEDIWEAIKKYDPTIIGYTWDDLNPRIQLEPIGNRGYIELVAIK